MKRIKQARPEHPSPYVPNFEIETIDAYNLAQDVIGDFAAIFEALDQLNLHDLGNDRISRSFYRLGIHHASDWLKYIDGKIAAVNTARKLLDKNTDE